MCTFFFSLYLSLSLSHCPSVLMSSKFYLIVFQQFCQFFIVQFLIVLGMPDKQSAIHVYLNENKMATEARNKNKIYKRKPKNSVSISMKWYRFWPNTDCDCHLWEYVLCNTYICFVCHNDFVVFLFNLFNHW